jgi:hypothetical protein
MVVEFTPIQITGKGWRAVHVNVIDKREKHEEPSNLPELPEQGQNDDREGLSKE